MQQTTLTVRRSPAPGRRARSPKRQKRRRRSALIILLLLFAAVGGALLLHLLARPGATPERPPASSVLGLPLYVDLLPEGAPGRPGDLREIKYVVIHETGNSGAGATAKSHNHFLHSGDSGTTSWHYTVDDVCAYQHLPDSEIAWHAGDRRDADGGNACGIGIELCVNRDGDFEATFQNGAKLAAFLLYSYDLSAGDLRQHADFIGKNCPQRIRESGRWEEFCTAVSGYLEELRGGAS